MSLVFFNGEGTSGETCALIREKTGVEISYINSTNEISIRFPDMDKSINIWSNNLSEGSNAICFVDAEEHFFMYVKPSGMNNSYGYIDKWIRIFIYENNGNIYNLMGGTDISPYYVMNFNYSITKNISALNNLNVYPLRIAGYSDENFKPKEAICTLKNVFVNYDRNFAPALKFIDQNKNEFITLGEYLLYYNGRHK